MNHLCLVCSQPFKQGEPQTRYHQWSRIHTACIPRLNDPSALHPRLQLLRFGRMVTIGEELERSMQDVDTSEQEYYDPLFGGVAEWDYVD